MKPPRRELGQADPPRIRERGLVRLGAASDGEHSGVRLPAAKMVRPRSRLRPLTLLPPLGEPVGPVRAPDRERKQWCDHIGSG